MSGKRDPWVNGQIVPGVTFPYNVQVEIISGAHAGQRGWLVGVDPRAVDPLYTIEMWDATDLEIPQSLIRLVPESDASGTSYINLRLHMLPTSEGGRTSPVAGRSRGTAAYKPHLRTSPSSEYLGVAFIDGPEWIYPGEWVEETAALIYVETGVDYSSLTVGAKVEVVEGTRVIARGEVLRRWSEPGDWRSRASV